MEDKVKRRLTSVLCADVKSYSRLMEADEVGTLATLRHYRDAMAALAERHDGRIVKTWGDAVIAEFPSVVEAVQCAVEIQSELSTRNRELPESRQMWFRVGINLGDVMVEGEEIYGEGVNIAARLQELAEPGGIMISGPVYQQVRNKLTIAFDYVGDQPFKNISEPVASYRVMLDGETPRAGFAAHTGNGSQATTEKPAAPARDPRRSWAAARSWWLSLPRPVATAYGLIAFLFVINLFAGLGNIWFHWPAAPLLLFTFLYRKSRSGEPGRHDKSRGRKP